jgi:hypothetical protein
MTMSDFRTYGELSKVPPYSSLWRGVEYIPLSHLNENDQAEVEYPYKLIGSLEEDLVMIF